MSKEAIERKALKKNMMKNIIFRIDYQGVIETNPLIKGFQENFKGYFQKFETAYQNKIDFDLNNIQDISDTLSIPVKEIERQEINRFSKNTFGKDEVTLDITKYYSVLHINCTNYECIDPYLEFYSKFVDFIFDTNEFLTIKRIGLRKIGGQIFFNIDEIFNHFEKAYFNFDFKESKYKSIRNNYVDVLHQDDSNPIINYARTLETGSYYKNETETDVPAYQVKLDLDGYYPENILNNIKFGKGKIKELLELTNHKHLFDLFKMSVTEEFLKQNCK